MRRCRCVFARACPSIPWNGSTALLPLGAAHKHCPLSKRPHGLAPSFQPERPVGPFKRGDSPTQPLPRVCMCRQNPPSSDLKCCRIFPIYSIEICCKRSYHYPQIGNGEQTRNRRDFSNDLFHSGASFNLLYHSLVHHVFIGTFLYFFNGLFRRRHGGGRRQCD